MPIVRAAIRWLRIPGDSSRLVWHLDIGATSERVLTAESVYLDWPRLVLAVIVVIVIAGYAIFIRGRAPVAPSIPTPPS